MFKNILKIFTGTFISRIFGFLRELIVASYFGTGKVADAFTYALIFPNLFRQILGEDMVERALIPPFKTIYDQNKIKDSWKYISIVFNWFFIALLLASAILYLVIPLLFYFRNKFPNIFGFIFSNKDFDYDLTLKLILIMLPFMIFIGLAAFVGGILNFFEKNWIFAFAPIMLSVGVIFSIVFLRGFLGDYSIAVGVLLGSFLQFLIQIPFLLSRKFQKESGLKYYSHLFLKKEDQKNLEFKTIKRESFYITLNSIFVKSSELFTRTLSINLLSGAVSSLYYSIRLYQLPFSIISLSIVRGINPQLNKYKANHKNDLFRTTFKKGMDLYFLVLLPLTIIMIVAAKDIVSLVYERGHFSSRSMLLTSEALSFFSLGLIPMSFTGYFLRVLSLFNKNKYALWVSIISSITNILAALFFTKIMGMDHRGIALASSLSFFVNSLVLFFYLKRELADLVIILTRKEFLFNSLMLILGVLMIFIIKDDFFLIENRFLNSLFNLGTKSFLVLASFGVIYFVNPFSRKYFLKSRAE